MIRIKYRWYITMVLLVLSIASCRNDAKDSNTTQTSSSDSTKMEADSMQSAEGDLDSLDTEGQPLNEDNTGLMPKIESSYFGLDPEGHEVSYNFLPGNKFEKFAFKNGKENLISGTYKQEGDEILLSSSSEKVKFRKNDQGGYDVMRNGKKSYSVKNIN